MTDPGLREDERAGLTAELMRARRAIGVAKRRADRETEGAADDAVDAAKRALGERGSVWWDDGAPDFNRHMARTTLYADWLAGLGGV